MTIDSIYNTRILDLAGNIPRIGRLDSPDGSSRAHSKLCGSTVIVDVNVSDGCVTDYAHDVKACALGQASSSIMARHIIGCTLPELRDLRDSMHMMLKNDGAPPSGKFSDLRFLEPVRSYRARHASTLLVFDAVVDAFESALTQKSDQESEQESDQQSARESDIAPSLA